MIYSDIALCDGHPVVISLRQLASPHDSKESQRGSKG